MAKLKKEENNIKLTITMLVSNRKDTIRKCMDSINPILQQVPSELIVVDTGSTDGSMDIVKEYTRQIVSFPWCNDFGAARNAGLKEARGEWVMFLDDDEWFEDVSEIIEFFNTGEYKKYNTGSYITRNYTAKDGSSWSDANATRMAKRSRELAFVGKIHEMLYPMKAPVKYFEAYAHHYGYVFHSEKEEQEHSRRNIALLLQELEENPWDARLNVQMIQEYFGIGEVYKVIEICQKILSRYGNSSGQKAYVGYCSNYLLRAYSKMGDWEEAYHYGCEALGMHQTTRPALLGNRREMIKICRERQDYEEATEHVQKYLALYDELQKKRNQREVVLDLSRYLQTTEREMVLLEGMALGVLGKNPRVVEESMQKFDWDKIPLTLYPDTIDYLMEHLGTQEVQKEHVVVFQKILAKKTFQNHIAKNMEKYYAEEKKYKNLLALFGESDHNSVLAQKYRFYYHMQVAYDWAPEKAQQELEALLKKMENPLLLEEDMWKIIEKWNLNPQRIICEIPYLRWFSLVRIWTGRREKELMRKSRLLNPEEKTNPHFAFLNLKCKEAEILADENQEPKVLMDLLKEYSHAALEFFAGIYQPGLFEEEKITMLPPEGVFAYYIKNAFMVYKEGNTLEYGKMLTKAAGAYPGMKEICRKLLKYEKEQEKKKQQAEKEIRKGQEKNEFYALAEMVKGKIRMLIWEGEYEAAGQTLQQLKAMIPEDEELAELEKQVHF